MAARKKWYSEGLRFSCTGCGYCCSGQPGYVYVNDDEIAQISQYLGMDASEFLSRFTRETHRERSLVERPNGDCVFLDPVLRSCRIYPIRPRQCKSFPFWNSNLRRPKDWDDVCRTCPGCGKGPVFSYETIEELRGRIDI